MILRVFLGFVLISLSASTRADIACSATSGSIVKPLVELYTSEGCSSCPPADRWFSSQTGRDDINLLAFHVDYWDAIGWPDRFASPAYSQRQRMRVRNAGSSSVYTPQVMVGANVTTIWRTRASFNAAVDVSKNVPAPSLSLSLERGADGPHARLSVSRNGPPDSSTKVWLAQYSDNQTSVVRAGENRGATLHHDRVVQKLWGPWPLGTADVHLESITIPSGKWGLVAFAQDAEGSTLQSLGLPSSHCVE